MAPTLPYVRLQYGPELWDRAFLWTGLLTDESGGAVVMSTPLHLELCQLSDAALQAVGFGPPRPSVATPGGWMP